MSESRVIFRTGAKTILRPICESDIPQLIRWVNDPEVTQYLSRYRPVTQRHEENWLDKIHEDDDTIVLGIEPKDEQQLIGTMGLNIIRHKDRVAGTGTMIGSKQYWGDGYGTDAKMLQLRYAFYQENIRKVISSVYATNKRSIAYLKKCGYKKEGIRKESRYVNGRYVDVVLMAVFQRDWEPIWDEYANKHDLK